MRSIFWLNFLEGPKANSELGRKRRQIRVYAISLPSGGRRRNHHPLFLLQRSGAITRHKLALFSGALLAVSVTIDGPDNGQDLPLPINFAQLPDFEA